MPSWYNFSNSSYNEMQAKVKSFFTWTNTRQIVIIPKIECKKLIRLAFEYFTQCQSSAYNITKKESIVNTNPVNMSFLCKKNQNCTLRYLLFGNKYL